MLQHASAVFYPYLCLLFATSQLGIPARIPRLQKSDLRCEFTGGGGGLITRALLKCILFYTATTAAR